MPLNKYFTAAVFALQFSLLPATAIDFVEKQLTINILSDHIPEHFAGEKLTTFQNFHFFGFTAKYVICL